MEERKTTPLSKPTTSKEVRRWWKRATSAVKDRCSICLAQACLNRRHSTGFYRNPDIERAVILATSHEDTKMDYKNVQRALSWFKISPTTSLDPLLWALSRRMRRTRDWVVVLKGLLLFHSMILCSESTSDVNGHHPPIGRLPFDLSMFRDRSLSDEGNSWKFNTFVRAYYQFLDRRSILLQLDGGPEDDNELGKFQRRQDLMELLMQIMPTGDGMKTPLILEAMDCVIVEIYQIHKSINHSVNQTLMAFSSRSFPIPSYFVTVGIKEVGILKRAKKQSSNLADYLDVCKELGVLNANQLLTIEFQTVPEELIKNLETLLRESSDNDEETSQKKSAPPHQM